MYINQIYELTMILDNEKFQKILSYAHKKSNCWGGDDGEYIDQSMASKGITVKYRDSQYKKRVELIINSGRVVDYDKTDPSKFLRKLNNRIGEYFNHKYNIDAFGLSGTTFVADIDVGSCERVAAYLKVLQRIGKVKRFSPTTYEFLDDVASFCLDGNSNGVAFLIYDFQGMCRKRYKDNDMERKRIKTIIKGSEGILRAEVQLAKPKAIRNYTCAVDVGSQIVALLERGQDIFLNIFTKIIPFGDFYKKNKAIEIIRREVEDSILRRKMLRLVALIPEKKSLYLAQKTMDCRNVENVMEMFAKINLSPVTISKRQDVKYLENVYTYIF